MNLLLIFIVLNIVNVILQTIKSIATIKCGKVVASVVNAIAFGLYTIVIVYTNCDLSLWAKVIVVALTNLIGVYVVKTIEEKIRKDKLWCVNATVKENHIVPLQVRLNQDKLPYTMVKLENDNYYRFDIYCNTQTESTLAKKNLEIAKAKWFVTESKIL